MRPRPETHNLGRDLAVMAELLTKARAAGYVGAGEVAMREALVIIDHWLSLDKQVPLRLSTESVEVRDDELGEVTGSQSRWIGDWWFDVPEIMPLSPGVARQLAEGNDSA